MAGESMNTRLAGIGMTSARTRERLVQRLRATGITNEAVLNAMRRIPRHLFVDEALASRAYEDTALPIGHNQTISQPYSVARMTELLFAEDARRVLEVGTGSGYQTAILCSLAAEVFSVERIEPLHRSARRCLQELGFRNFRLHHTDGSLGWQDYAPFDGILVTAAATEIPEALFAQLAPGGRMVVPVGNADHQELVLIRNTSDGVVREHMEMVNFVPLVPGASR
jgi:protein-L-isoaspartate(D-aspartate) O-methyltransferase